MAVGAFHLASRFLDAASPPPSNLTGRQSVHAAAADIPSTGNRGAEGSVQARPILSTGYTDPGAQLAALYTEYAGDIVKARRLAERFCRETTKCPTCTKFHQRCSNGID